jgi:hypothetical protein
VVTANRYHKLLALALWLVDQIQLEIKKIAEVVISLTTFTSAIPGSIEPIASEDCEARVRL